MAMLRLGRICIAIVVLLFVCSVLFSVFGFQFINFEFTFSHLGLFINFYRVLILFGLLGALFMIIGAWKDRKKEKKEDQDDLSQY